jgi:hypothetical protein
MKTSLVLATLTLMTARMAHAETASTSSDAANASANEAEHAYGSDVRLMVPVASYTYSAMGAPEKTMGASLTGFALGDRGRGSVLGGGASVWGAPIARLTLIADATRSVYREFSPSFGATFRLYGTPNRGLNLGALARYKVEGFGKGPAKDEVEGEVEGGVLVGYHKDRLHLDGNTILGVGATDDGEIDIEARARAGYDISQYVRVGIDGQVRIRASGPRVLANGSNADWVFGPQAMVSSGHFFGTFLAGPTTTGTLSPKVGTIVALSLGGTAF